MSARRRLFWVYVTALALALVPRMAQAEDSAPLPKQLQASLQALRAGGVAVLLRHAQTVEGSGDPPGFRLEDCSTQRNLSAEGRAQAQRIGEWFKRQRIVPAVVRNSAWCRARDTAQLAFGRSEDWAPLANLFEDRTPERRNSEAVRDFVATLKERQVAVLVTHGSSIGAFVGVHPAQGEGVLVRAERTAGGAPRLVVLGRLVVP